MECVFVVETSLGNAKSDVVVSLTHNVLLSTRRLCVHIITASLSLSLV
jgi:hypothetical protein